MPIPSVQQAGRRCLFFLRKKSVGDSCFHTKRLYSSKALVVPTVVMLLAIHAGMLAWAATKHSPTMLEPAFLVAGISHWKFGTFELFRVNPPLTRMVAALPVMAAGCETDWSAFYEAPGARAEFALGSRLVAVNGERSLWLLTLARWSCIPFSLIGGLFCFLWSRELWQHSGAGLIALALWCFDPNVLAHAELITTESAAAAFGLGAGYFFWRWLKQPTWSRAFAAGLFLGLAELTKMSWLVLFGLWPGLWLLWYCSAPQTAVSRDGHDQSATPAGTGPGRTGSARKQVAQLAIIVAFGAYLINLGYGYDGTFTKLKDFNFVSHTLTGKQPGTPGNRFTGTCLANLRLPMPKSYVLGFDTQKRDFEDYGRPSYLRGEWKLGGWWYYYLYGLAVKTPHGTQIIVAVVAWYLLRHRPAKNDSLPGRDHHATDPISDHSIRPHWCDVVVVLAPAISLLLLVSSQTQCNEHLRYILPAFGFVFVLAGAAAVILPWRRSLVAGFILACLWNTAYSSVENHPHNIAYFNWLAGGPANGYRHLRGSSLGWGHDVLSLAKWIESRQLNPDTCCVLLPTTYDIGDIGFSVPARSIKSPLDAPNLDRQRFANVICNRSICPRCQHGTCSGIPDSPELSVCWCMWFGDSGNGSTSFFSQGAKP